jgi:tetratricopeptide (TPR) repeat protein
MIRRAGLSCLGLLGLLALLAAGGPAHARAAHASGEKEARELFQKAEMSFNLGKFADALADYQAAYQAKPLPGFLFNIAQCYRHMQDYERARFFYRRYLALDAHTSNRPLVEDLITEMTHLIERTEQAKLVPPPVTVAPPTEPPPTTGAVLPPAAPATVAIAPTLEPAAAVEPAPLIAVSPAADAPDTTKAPARRPIYKRWWFWGAVGAAVVGAGVITLAATRDDAPSASLGTIDARH